MMRVLVEIHPGGDESTKRTIATIDIANVSDLAELSDYSIDADLEGMKRSGAVFGHQRSTGWIPLVRRVLLAIGGRS